MSFLRFPQSVLQFLFFKLAGKKKHVRPLLIERVQLQHEVSIW